MFNPKTLRELERAFEEDPKKLEWNLLSKKILLSIKHERPHYKMNSSEWLNYDYLVEKLDKMGFSVKKHSDFCLVGWH